ncbi:MAG: ROK family protein [Cyclobacteriaceae bacterium]|nr:ROK family protein [Cyclobacteriaceae bacterium]
MEQLWGIDLGGTKVEGVVLDAETYEVISRTRIPTEKEHGYEHIISQIHKLVELLKEQTASTPGKIGIGTPGAIDPTTQTLKNSNTVCLNYQPLKRDLESMLGLPVEMANDANCFALAEARMGIVPDIYPHAQVVFGVIMGTGVGGGIVIDKKIINGKQGIAGEWGHSFLDDSGGKCYCGDIGCVERIISGPALERYYREISGKQARLPEIVQAYREQNDTHAAQTMERLLHFFGKGLSNVINILDPDVVVLGGGVGNIEELYQEGIERLKDHIFNTRFETIVAKPKLGDSAGVFGAAFLGA